MIKIFLSVFLQEYFMVGKRNRILQTKKHQDTGGDHVCEMRFLAKKYVFQKNKKVVDKRQKI